jgi:flagellar biosynthesis/type III secretory pathway protein FliH
MPGFEASESRRPAVFVPDPGPTTAAFVAPPPPEPEETETAPSAEALEQAFAAGYEAGETATRDSLPQAEAEELKSAALVLRRSVEALEERSRGQLVAEPRALVELALSISEHLLRQQLGRDADALIARVSQAIQSMPEREPVRIEVSNQDRQALGEVEDALAALASDAIEIEAHAGLAAGEFRLTAGAAETDGRLRALLASVRESLAEECADEEDAG